MTNRQRDREGEKRDNGKEGEKLQVKNRVSCPESCAVEHVGTIRAFLHTQAHTLCAASLLCLDSFLFLTFFHDLKYVAVVCHGQPIGPFISFTNVKAK